MAGKFCDVCDKDDMGIAGVASSGLGPVSFAYCPICSAMGAEPKFMIEVTIEGCGGSIKNIREGVQLTYYNSETDSYIDKREGDIPITLKSGEAFKTRSELVRYKQLDEKGD